MLVVQYHDTAPSGTYYSDLRNCDNSCSVCVVKHVTVSRVDFVQDWEKEDPQISDDARWVPRSTRVFPPTVVSGLVQHRVGWHHLVDDVF